MTKAEFLVKVGLDEDDFRNLVEKFQLFEGQLNPAQLEAVRRSIRPRSEALHSLGGRLTTSELNKILKAIGTVGGPDEDPGNRDGGVFNGSSVLAGKVNGQNPKS